MDISYQIIRSTRKTLSLQITPVGEVIVRCPKRYPVREIEKFVESKRAWLEKHLAKIEARETQPVLTEAELRQMAEQAAKLLPERVRYFAPLVGVSYGRITIRSQHTRWGSCSAKGNLNFNCLLLLCPEAVQDYVVVHELCHRKELNHSPAFWAEVERICPDYKTHRKWLKENGSSLIGRLP
ncbi:MAG: M48 family metallopeptidase [Oscillospiraceae bacterium]|nr:M48 family metallopeptidase [Oscillospiraceae bacterium]